MIKISKTLIFFFLMIVPIVSVSAQYYVPEADFVIKDEYVLQFQWLPDSTGLRVFGLNRSEESLTEFQYNLATQSKQLSNEQMMSQQTDQLDSINKASTLGVTGGMTLSPDKQWAVFVALSGQQLYLSIEHLSSEQLYVVKDAPLITEPFAVFKVRWSEDSSAFYVYNARGSVTYTYYVSNLTTTWEDMTVIQLDCYGCENVINQALGLVGIVFDIDTTGKTLLLERSFYSEEGLSVTQIVTLNMKTLRYEVLIDKSERPKAASFGPKDEIYYIDIEGMHIYDPESDTSHLLNSEINSSWIWDAEISTDGRYVAATNGDDSLYIIPVTPQ